MTLTPPSRRGNATPMAALVILFLLAAILGIALVLYDGAEGTANEARNPPVGSVEGNLAAHAIAKSLVIKQFLNTNGSLPTDTEGTALIAANTQPRAELSPPAPIKNGNPTYRKTNNGFELVFAGVSGKPVVCAFSAQGAYEGATGLDEFMDENQQTVGDTEGGAP